MYFVTMDIKLGLSNRNLRLTIADAAYAHAAICHAISNEDSDAGRRFHNMGRDKRMSLALLNSSKGVAILRLSFMTDDGISYANHLINALIPCSTLRLGNSMCKIEEIDLANSERTGISTWSDLKCDKFARHLSFRFLTPTAITKKDGLGKRFVSLYPEPRDVFLSLADRYEMLEGPSLPCGFAEFLKKGGCVISKYDLRTTLVKTKERPQKGFIGTVEYECRMHDHVAYNVTLNTLTRLAPFTGIGYQTARGMGAVQVSLR